MKIFLAVVIDLLEFVFSALPSFGRKNTNSNESVLALPAAAEEQVSFKPAPRQFLQKTVTPVGVLESSETAYIAVSAAKMMEQPRWVFDSVVADCSYGEAVKVFGYEGRFVRVQYKNLYGWILKDEVTFNQADVFPSLLEGKVYLAADVETRKLRQLIKDEYFAADLYLPLQAVEFITYTLGQQGIKITWPVICPRVAGRWQMILKGAQGVFISISPKTGSVMEYFTKSGDGQVLYVKTVQPDETIAVYGVGTLLDGEYTETKLSKAEWQELGAVFIQFT